MQGSLSPYGRRQQRYLYACYYSVNWALRAYVFAIEEGRIKSASLWFDRIEMSGILN